MVFHRYNEILIISSYLGIAILKCERAAPAATACPALLDRRASMFRNVLYRLSNIYWNLWETLDISGNFPGDWSNELLASSAGQPR